MQNKETCAILISRGEKIEKVQHWKVRRRNWGHH